MITFTIEAILHVIGEDGELVRSTRVHDTDELAAATPTNEEIALGYQGMIENLSMKPAVDKLITIMQHCGVTFGYGKYLYAYREGVPMKMGQEADEFMRRSDISEAEVRVAAQSHLTTLLSPDKEEEFAYIEEQYTKVAGVTAAIGQTSIYDYIEEESV